MGWSEQDEQLAQDIQVRVDLETKTLREHVAALTTERDFLLGKEILGSNALEASQAREAMLREAMQYDLEKNDGLFCATHAALALPTDDSALQQWLAEELEKIAKHYDTTMPSVSQHIRNMK